MTSDEGSTAPEPLRAGSLLGGAARDPALREAEVADLVAELVARARSGGERNLTPRLVKHLGVLHGLLGEVAQSRENRYSLARSMDGLRRLTQHPDFRWETFEGSVCVEVGGGGLSPVAPLFVLLAAGAERAVCVDPDEVRDVSSAVRAMYESLAGILAGIAEPRIPASPATLLDRVASFDLRRLFAGDLGGIDASRLQYLRSPLAQAGLEPGTVDVLSTNSVLEHVPEPAAFVAECARLARPGGLQIHAIDGFDHRRYGDPAVGPLDFLRERDGEPIVAGCNRIRPLAFGAWFEEHGFEIRDLRITQRVALTDADVASFAPAFRALPREHLEAARATYYLRRR